MHPDVAQSLHQVLVGEARLCGGVPGQRRSPQVGMNASSSDTIDTLYYRRQVTPEDVHTILQSHCEGSSLRGVSRISKRAYGTVVDIIRKASEKAQMIHNQEVYAVDTDRVESDEL